MLLSNIFLILGFCLGTVGAAGFGPETESLAWPFLIAGTVLISVGAILRRRLAQSPAASQVQGQGSASELKDRLSAVTQQLHDLQEVMDSLDDSAFFDQLDAVLDGAVFDLTKDSEDFMRGLGFAQYAKVWDGIACGERLLARAWSMATDGHCQEARAEVRFSAAEFSRAENS